MSYQPHALPPNAAARARVARAAALARRRPNGAPRRAGLGDLGSAQTVAISTIVAQVPFVGGILSPLVGPLSSIFDPGAKRDAGRRQRAEGISKLASEGSLLAARQLYSAAERGGVGAKAEIALYAPLWSAFQQSHPEIATAARAAGPAPLGPDPSNGWTPSASDVAQYSREVQQYQQLGTVASAAQAAGARAAGFPGGTTGLALGVGLVLAFMRRRGR